MKKPNNIDVEKASEYIKKILNVMNGLNYDEGFSVLHALMYHAADMAHGKQRFITMLMDEDGEVTEVSTTLKVIKCTKT